MSSDRGRRSGDGSGPNDGDEIDRSPWPGKRSITGGRGRAASPSAWPGKRSITASLARDASRGGYTPARIPNATKQALSSEEGSPLQGAERFSDQLGDVSHARLVTGPTAEQAADAVGARAFTVGHRVFFGSQGSPGDEALLRHELTHVAQQRGATMPSLDSLAITSHDDAVEHEARSNSANISETGTVALARDSILDVDAKQYCAVVGSMIAADVNKQLALVDLKLDSAYAKWKSDGKALMTAAFHFDAMNVRALGGKILGLDVFDRAVNKGRKMGEETFAPDEPPQQSSTKGPLVYSANVAIEIANQITALASPAVARLVPRYCEARSQAKLVVDKAAGKTTSDLPEPKPAEIVASSQIDLVLRDGMCKGVIDFDVAKYQADHHETEPSPNAKREIAITIDQVGPMFFWVVAKPKSGGGDATVEEVSQALYNDTTHALELTKAGPRFGSKNGGDLADTYKTALAAKGATKDFLSGWQGVTLDPANELLKDPKAADTAALEQAKAFKGTGAGKDDVIKRLGANLNLFDAIVANAQKFGLDGALAGARQRIVDLETKLATASAADAMNWDAHSARQGELLKGISNGLTSTVSYLTSMTEKSDPKGFAMGDELRMLLRDSAEAYTIAAAQSHLLEVGGAKLQVASDKQQSLPFDIMEALLRQVEKSVADVKKHDGSTQYDTDTILKKKDELRAKIAAKRVEVLNNPTLLQSIVEELFSEVGDVKTETSMVQNMDQLDELIRKLADKHWQDYYVGGDPGPFGYRPKAPFEMMNEARAKVEALRTKWIPIYALWKSGTPENKKTAKEQLKALFADGSYVKTMQDAQQTLKEVQEYRALVTILVTVVAMVAITLFSMGIGTMVGAGVTGALGGAVAAGTIAASTATAVGAGAALVTEAAVFTALNTFFMEDPSWSNIGKEFVFNLAVFGGMKALSKVYRSAEVVQAALKAGGVAKGVAIGGEMTLQAIAMSASAIAHEKIQGRELSKEEYNKIFAQSAGMFIAMAIAGRAAAPLFKELEIVGGGIGAKISGMNVERQALFTAAIAAKDNPSAAAIEALIQKDAAELKIEMDALELISKNAPLIEAAGIKGTTAKQIATDAGNALFQAKVADALNTHAISEAAGIYRTTPEGKDKILAVYGKDAEVVPAGKDTTAKTETFVIKPTEGKGPQIRLTVGEARPANSTVDAPAHPVGEPPAGSPAVVPSLDGVPHDSADAARWQTQAVTNGKPEVWATKAKDGTTFRDVYEKWIKQDVPYKGSEPVKPDGVSAEAWKEFEPQIKKILADHNFQTAMEGNEIVKQLKDAKIDLAHLDPMSPEYQKIRPQLLAKVGEAKLAHFEASLTRGEGDPARAAADAQVKKVLADSAIPTLKSTFPDCEILLTGEATKSGGEVGKLGHVDVILLAPDGVTPEVRIGLEERANQMSLPAGEAVTKAGGPKELKVSAKAMTKEQYLGIKSADKAGPDIRVDGGVKTAAQVADQYGITDAAARTKFEALFKANPAEAAGFANAMKPSPGLAGRLLGIFGNAVSQHFKPMGDGRVSIHGECELAPEKLASLTEDAQIQKLVDVCKNKGPVADYEFFESTSTKPPKPGARMRFVSRLKSTAGEVVDKILAALKIAKTDPRVKFLENPNDGDLTRLWDVTNERAYRNKDVLEQSAKWALSKNPKSAGELVAEMQFFDAEVGRQAETLLKETKLEVDRQIAAEEAKKGGALSDGEKNAITKSVTKAKLGRELAAIGPAADTAAVNKVLSSMGVEVTHSDGTTSTALADASDAAWKTNTDALTGPNATGKVGMGQLGDTALKASLRSRAAELNFNDDANAAYHAHKHAGELPVIPSPKTEMVDYLHAARDLVASRDGNVRVNQDGSRSVIFEGNGMRVIVRVGADGGAAIATFGKSN